MVSGQMGIPSLPIQEPIKTLHQTQAIVSKLVKIIEYIGIRFTHDLLRLSLHLPVVEVVEVVDYLVTTVQLAIHPIVFMTIAVVILSLLGKHFTRFLALVPQVLRAILLQSKHLSLMSLLS